MSDDSSLGWLEGFCIRPSPRAKHVRLKVVPPGRVEVVVPRGYDQRQLPNLLARHEAWLSRTVEKVRKDYGGPQRLLPPASVAFAAVGRRYRVEYRKTKGAPRCRLQPGDALRVHDDDNGGWREALHRWVAEQGRAHLVPWLDAVSGEVGLPYGRATVRSQKTRWGSCSARKNISINSALLFLAPEMVRYLFIHELCHTIHMNHSRRFWALVGRLEPDFRRLDDALRLAACDVPAWARRD